VATVGGALLAMVGGALLAMVGGAKEFDLCGPATSAAAFMVI